MVNLKGLYLKKIDIYKEKYQSFLKFLPESFLEKVYLEFCDDYDIKQDDSEFLKNAKQYCSTKGYDFVWFCKDVERVYIGKKVDDSEKKREAATFKEKKLIANVEMTKLSETSYKANTSNIINILDKYLERK